MHSKVALAVMKAMRNSHPRLSAIEEADLLLLSAWIVDGCPAPEEDEAWADDDTRPIVCVTQ